MKLATTTGELEGFVQTSADAVRVYEGTGFTHLDFSFYRVNFPGSPFMEDGKDWMREIVDAGKAAEKLGFDFVQAHAPANNPFKDDFDETIKGNLRTIEACAYLGIKNVVLHAGNTREMRYPNARKEFFERNRAFYEKLYPAMEKFDVNVLTENGALGNSGGSYFFMTGEEIRDFLDFCGNPRLLACWDVGHANMQDPNQYKDIMALGGKLAAVHIQDNMGRSDDHLAPFMGTLDVDSVMRGLIDNGFVARGGVFTFEADNMLSRGRSWPNGRNHFSTDVGAPERIPGATLAMKKSAISLLYTIGKEILTAYGLYEG